MTRKRETFSKTGSPLKAPYKLLRSQEQEQEQEQEQKNTPPTPRKRGEGDEKLNGFDRFWQAYPLKRSRGQAEKAWVKLKANEQLIADILAGVERAKTSLAWLRDGGKFIPHPATWLNAKGWLDEVEPPGYSPDELSIIQAYAETLAEAGWPAVVTQPFCPERSVAIRDFLAFCRPEKVSDYFAWLRDNLKPRAGCGLEWALQRNTYLRAREGNFAALRDVA